MKKGVQQIMLGSVTGSEAAARATLQRIRAAGYDGLELNRFMTPILKQDSLELGTGNMDLDSLREIALQNGIQAVVLESHKNWIDRDPVRSLELSARWLKGRF